MNIKKLNIIILATAVCLCMSSCNIDSSVENNYDSEIESTLTSEPAVEKKPPLETYKALVFNPGAYSGVKYNEPHERCPLLPRDKISKYNVPDKTITLGSDTISMKYHRTYNIGYSDNVADDYWDIKSDVSASFHEEDGSLYSLHPRKNSLGISDRAITDEIYLLEVCDAYVSEYVKDLTRYTVSVGTRIQKSTAHSFGGSYVEGFTLAPSDDEVTTYTAIYNVEYRFYVNGIETEDFIRISVTEDGCLNSFSINMTGKFNKYSDYDVDMKRCDRLIDEEISHICGVDGYVLEEYDTTKLWAIINGQLCLIVSVTPTITNPNETESDAHPHIEPTKILIAVSEQS